VAPTGAGIRARSSRPTSGASSVARTRARAIGMKTTRPRCSANPIATVATIAAEIAVVRACVMERLVSRKWRYAGSC